MYKNTQPLSCFQQILNFLKIQDIKSIEKTKTNENIKNQSLSLNVCNLWNKRIKNTNFNQNIVKVLQINTKRFKVFRLGIVSQ